MGLFNVDFTGLGGITTVIDDILKMFPNAEQRAAAEAKLQDLVAQVAAAQSATNTEEAKSSNIFVAGWRPFIGWVCGLGFVYSIIGAPLHLPVLDTNPMIMVLSGMLGLGTMRTAEKIGNVPDTKVRVLGRK
jgi:hypothetical protein